MNLHRLLGVKTMKTNKGGKNMQKSKKFLALLLFAAMLLSSLGVISAAGAEAGAVTGLSARLDGSRVMLSWNAASGAEKYQVNMASSSNGPWKSLKSVTSTSAPVSSGISAGNTYYFMVQGFTEGSAGERYYGAQSNVVSIHVPKAGEVGQATNFSVSVSGNTVSMQWSAAANATRYEIQRSAKADGGFQSQKSVTGTSTSQGNLANGTYYYRVMPFKEVDGKRVYGTASSVKSATIGSGSGSSSGSSSGAVGQATNFSLSVSGRTVSMQWSAAANATKYEVQRSAQSGSGFQSQKSVTGTSTSQGNLADGTYYYRVMPFKEVNGKRVYGTASGEQKAVIGNGGSSAPTTPSGEVGQVTDLVVTLSGSTAKLSWKAAANATKYEVQRSTKADSGFVSMKSVTGTSTTNGGLQKGNTYYYRVMPFKEVNGKRVYGTASAVRSVSMGTAGSSVGDVTGLTVTGIGSSSVSLRWNSASNALYYEVRRGTSPNGPFVSQKSVTATSATNTVPDVGTYYYQVCGYVVKSDNTRAYGNPSDVVEAKIGVPGPIGAIRSISVAKKNDSVVTVSWSSATNANRYILYGSADGSNFSAKGSTDKLTMDWSVGNVGGTFYFKVLPVYQVNGSNKSEGGFSQVTSIKMAKFTIPGVSGLTLSANGKKVKLSWTATPYANQYAIERATSSSGPFSGIKAVDKTTAENEVPGAGTYFYRVAAIINDFNGNRVYGSFSAATRVEVLLGATIDTIKATDVNTITLTWTGSTGYYDGYEVYRKAKGESAWTLMPSTHIKRSGSDFSFFDDTVVPGTDYSYSVTSYIIRNGVKTSSTIGANAKSLTTSIGTPSITAGYGISSTEGIFISWTDLPDMDTWEVQASTSIDSEYTTIATVDETTFSDYEYGKVRPNGVYLRTTTLGNGIAYYVRVRGVSTVGGANVYGTWSKPILVSAPSVVFTDVSTTKSSASVYLKVVNTGDMYLYLPASGSYWTDGQNIYTKYGITLQGNSEVKPGQEVTSQRFDFSDGVSRTPSSSSMFDIVFWYNGYSYSIQPTRDGVATWHIR